MTIPVIPLLYNQPNIDVEIKSHSNQYLFDFKLSAEIRTLPMPANLWHVC